jgi:hypothetical protein
VEVTRSEIIKACISAVASRSVDFSADEVVNCAFDTFGDELREDAIKLQWNAVKREVVNALKRNSGQDPDGEYEQLALDGFGKVPKFIPFIAAEDGKINFVDVRSARREHLRQAIMLRQRNVTFATARLNEMERLARLVESAATEEHPDPTVSEALTLHAMTPA